MDSKKKKRLERLEFRNQHVPPVTRVGREIAQEIYEKDRAVLDALGVDYATLEQRVRDALERRGKRGR